MQDLRAILNSDVAHVRAELAKHIDKITLTPSGETYDPALARDLTGPQYGFSPKQQIQLERKEEMKRRGLGSPDCGDMLAMTFSVQLAMSRQALFEERLQHNLEHLTDPTNRAIHARKLIGEELQRQREFGLVNNRSNWRRRYERQR